VELIVEQQGRRQDPRWGFGGSSHELQKQGQNDREDESTLGEQGTKVLLAKTMANHRRVEAAGENGEGKGVSPPLALLL
jgi:hypothetical protein